MSKHTGNLNGEVGLVLSHFQSDEYFFTKGLEASRAKDFKKAKLYFERALQLDPQHVDYHSQLAITLTKLGDFHRSIECLHYIIDHLNETAYECYFFIANNYAHLGLFDHAMKYVRLYLEFDADGEFVEEAEDLMEVIEDDDDIIDMLFDEEEKFLLKFEQANQELKNENYLQAIMCYEALLKQKPTYWSAHNRLAEAHYLNGDPQKAIELLQMVLKKDPTNFVARCYMMVFYYETGKTEEAELLKDVLIHISPIDMDQCYLLGLSLGKVGEHERAYQWLERLYRNGYGDTPDFYHQHAVACFYIGKMARARSSWRKISLTGHEVGDYYLKKLDHGELISVSYEYDIPIE